MKLRLPARTTVGLPLTGARRYGTDASSASDATRAETPGETVLMSARIVPGRAAATTAAATDSNASSSDKDIRTMSTASAKPATDSATVAPRAARASAFARLRFCTTSSQPASRRRSANAEPMLPSPISPTAERVS